MKNLINKILKEVNLAKFCEKHYGASFGKDNKSLCIFHSEKTPSLHYYADSNSILCFSKCYMDELYKVKKPKEGQMELSPALNIFHVVGLKEGFSCDGQGFVSILKFICESEGIDFDFKTKKVDPKKQQLLEFKTNLAMSYVTNLKSKKNETHMVQAYLMNDRGLLPQTIADFFLGLTNENESKLGRPYMSNRLSIPILNDEGNGVLAISARHLIGSDGGMKYVHDSNDEIWERGNVLYGYSHAKKYAKALNHLYVVEGYFDMISLYQAGVKNVVAIMSNIITEAQIDKILTLTKNVTMILDQDTSGVDGFKSRFEIMLRKGLNVKVIPNLKFKGKDANDLCIELKWNEMAIKSFLTSCSKNGVQFMLEETLEKYDETILKARYEALTVTNAVLGLIQDPIQKINYESYLNGRLGL